jgi:hypothetical protein
MSSDSVQINEDSLLKRISTEPKNRIEIPFKKIAIPQNTRFIKINKD